MSFIALVRKQIKKPTLLTGEIKRPIADPNIRCIDDRYRILFTTKTLPDCLDLLREIFPYWVKNQSKYPDRVTTIAQAARYTLIALSVKCKTMLPPIPQDFDGIVHWTLFVELYLSKRSNLRDFSYQNNPDINMSLKSKAIGYLFEHRDKSVTAIAKAVGVDRRRLHEMDDFMAARKVIKDTELTSRIAAKPTGTKDGKTGDIEAWK